MLCVLVCLAAGGSYAQFPAGADDTPQASPGDSSYEPKNGETVADVKVVGNRRRKEGEIFRQLQTRSGTPFSYEVVGDDVRRLVRNLQFVDVKTIFTPSPEGVVVTYRVVERPTLEAQLRARAEERRIEPELRRDEPADEQLARPGQVAVDQRHRIVHEERLLDDLLEDD